MTRYRSTHPTATQLAAAMEQGRRERAAAFRHGLRAIGALLSGGRPQVR